MFIVQIQTSSFQDGLLREICKGPEFVVGESIDRPFNCENRLANYRDVFITAISWAKLFLPPFEIEIYTLRNSSSK